MTGLKIGVYLTDSGRTPPERIPEYARWVEATGLDMAFTGDHLLAGERPIMDSVAVLAAAAAVTQRVELGFGVMVLPLRPVAWVAKHVATLQGISNGRVILGVGTGGPQYGPEAWLATGLPERGRGRRTDDALRALPDLIAGRPADVNGTTIALSPAAQVPPIWVGGGGDVALRRAARYGDAWFPSMVPPEAVGPAASRLAEMAAEAGRPAPAVVMGGVAGLGPGIDPTPTARELSARYGIPPEVAARLPITGTPAQAAERMAAYATAGVTRLVLGRIGGDWHRQCELLAEARSLLP
jgi:alkanesulfonate monooxygenase SsuD/methylene tetrahydromethanopterin reductase-like flavin-dependent oxidoreductase (luciferase family)